MGGKDRLTQGGTAPGLGEAWRKESKTCGDIKNHCAIWNSRDGLNTQWVKSTIHRTRDELRRPMTRPVVMDVAVEDKVRHRKKDIKHMKIISNLMSVFRVHERKERDKDIHVWRNDSKIPF